MSCIEIYNITDLSETEFYQKYIEINLLFGGMLLISTLTTIMNMSMIYNMKKNINNIKEIISPPIYKVDS
jgi:hypothetical protein